MVDQALIYSAKMAARITTDFYDVEVERLLNAAMLDLGVSGVVIPSEVDDLVRQAAITYFLIFQSTRPSRDGTRQEVMG